MACPAPTGRGRTPLVYVYGDSLTPAADYQEQAAMSGYELVSEATGGSWMCGGYEIPQSDETRWWPRIMETLTEVEPDYLILEYQAWANYQLRCGGRPAQYPYTAADPGRGWRVYLQMFVDAAIAAGGRTHIVVVESPSAPASKPDWAGPMAIMDAASRTMAARLPAHITFVPIRQDFTRNGAYTTFGPVPALRQGLHAAQGHLLEPVPGARLAGGARSACGPATRSTTGARPAAACAPPRHRPGSGSAARSSPPSTPWSRVGT